MVGMLLDTGHRRFTDRSEERVLRAAGLEEWHAHGIEVDRKPDRVPELREDLADIQRGSDQLRDTGQPSDAVPTPTLTVEQGDRLDEGSDQATDTAHPFDVDGVEGVRDATRRAQIADDAATDQRAARISPTALQQPATRRGIEPKERSADRRKVRDAKDVSVEHRGQQ